MWLFVRTAVVGSLALAAGALASSAAFAAGPATDACALISNADIEHAVRLPQVSLTKHLPVRPGFRANSTCSLFLYRGHEVKLNTRAGHQALEAGSAVLSADSGGAPRLMPSSRYP